MRRRRWRKHRSSTSPGVSGPATLDISISAADVTGPSAPAVAVSGSDTVPSTDPGYLWPEQVDPSIASVRMEVVKISLMPAEETFDGGDMNGEMQNGNTPDPAPPPDKPRFITLVPDHPIPIDLLNLKNGRKFARFLNKFDQIPAGTYDKIRVYYQNVTVNLFSGETVRFHPTANSKFDIHFRQGHELVIPPVTTDTTQKRDGWVKLYSVKLDVVGLKLKIVGQGKSWKGSKVILRPQIFAEFIPPILYSVAGTADVAGVPPNFDLTLPNSGTFNVKFGTAPTVVIPVAYNGGTTWAYSDNVLGHSPWIVTKDETTIDPTTMPIFRTGAKVMAIGPFDTSSLAFQATDIVFTFPDVKLGVVDNGWKSDNTFILRLATDNVVYPKPDRYTAYYDNGVTFSSLTQDQAIDNNFRVKARGYNVAGPVPPNNTPSGIDAYWISWLGIGP